MSAYYEVIFGSGFYDCYRYVVKTDYPTTDYGALTDAVIDYLKEKKHRNIIDWSYEDTTEDVGVTSESATHYSWDTDGNLITLEPNGDTDIIYPDTFVVGGNCGDVLLHYGDFRINEISETEIKNAEIIEM